MKRKPRNCSKCAYFSKVKDWEGAIGLCEAYDGRIEKEHKNCDEWEGIKYKRSKNVIR